jgi:hypothetical protein
MIIQIGGKVPKLTVEFGPPPADPSKILARRERGRRNDRWIQAHWGDFLPHGFGKYVAVAGEEGFLADSAPEALALARQAHPEDDSVTVHYLNPHQGPKIYAHRG